MNLEQFDNIKSLFERYIQGVSTPEEKAFLAEIVEEYPDEELVPVLESIAAAASPDPLLDDVYWQSLLSSILQRKSSRSLAAVTDTAAGPDTLSVASHHPLPEHTARHSTGRKIWWAAAAIFILVIAGAYFWRFYHTAAPRAVADNSRQLQNDVLPGGNKAVLTLGNGRKIILDSAKGNIVQQGNFTIINIDGRLDYEGKGNALEYHTLSTPRGGQYNIRLPDGTMVWLNAASSITYPTVFAGNERNVTITGEAYFEVAKDKTKPFHVKANNMLVEVLGTHFNINSYEDESSIKTTLLEGRVRISRQLAVNSQQSAIGIQQPVVLTPGQQAQVTAQQMSVIKNADIEQAVAWKNGLFNFDNADLPAVLRQLGRWYDIDIQFEGPVPARTFQGKLDRGLKLSEVIELLGKMEVKFIIKGKKLIVTA